MQTLNKDQKAKDHAKATWGVCPAGSTWAQSHEKGTKDFFDAVLKKRFSYECDWLEEIVDFKQYAGKKVLEIGCGAGYDAYQFCKYGADYTGIDITPDNPVITKKHLGYYGYVPTVFEMDVEGMSFDEEFDYVYSFGVLHHVSDFQGALEKVYKALKPGGSAQIIVYHKNSVFYWLHIVFAQWILKRQFLTESLADRLSSIEYTTSDKKPLVRVYRTKELVHVFKKVGFTVIRTDVRKLLIEDLPGIIYLNALYSYIPKSWLVWLSKRFGWYLSIKVLKPLK